MYQETIKRGGVAFVSLAVFYIRAPAANGTDAAATLALASFEAGGVTLLINNASVTTLSPFLIIQPYLATSILNLVR